MAALKLGKMELDVPFFQAALSGYSDYAMRILARRFGCPLTLTGVMLAKSMANPRVLRKMCFRPGADEHPVGAQILSRTPATMAKAAVDLETAGYDLIDLNFACPAPKVLRRKRGGAMLNEPDLVMDTIKAVQDVIETPLIIKLRMGFNHQRPSQDYFWEIVTRSVENNVDALVIHGRTVTDMYRGIANWDVLVDIKNRFPQATIIGSGDIFSAQASFDLLRQTGLDGFVVARGAVGNPWIYQELRCLFENKPLPPAPSLPEQRDVIMQHLDDVLHGYEERRAVGYFRKFAAGYAKRHPRRKQVLLDIMKAKRHADVVDVIDKWYLDFQE